MIGINSLWKDFLAKVNTYQGGFWSPQNNFVRAVNDIQKQLMNEEFAKWQNNQSTTDSIYPFLETKNLRLVSNNNQAYDTSVLPNDFIHYSSARVIVAGNVGCGCTGKDDIDGSNGKVVECSADNKYIDPDLIALEEKHAQDNICQNPVRIIDNQRWGSLCGHYTKRPTIKNPAITMFAGGIKVFPKHVGIIVLDYFRNPKDAVFNYTLGTDNEIIYNPTGSVDLEWPEHMKPAFLNLLMKAYGAYTGQDNTYQIGAAESQLTQA